LCVTIYFNTNLILRADVFGKHRTDIVAAFLHGLFEKHVLGEIVFLVDASSIRLLVYLEHSGQRDDADRNLKSGF